MWLHVHIFCPRTSITLRPNLHCAGVPSERNACVHVCVCVCLYLAVSYFDSSSFDAAASKKMKGKIITFDASQTIYISTGLH